ETQRAQPAVLVVDGGHTALVGKPYAGPHCVEILLVRPDHVALLEAPRRLLAQHAGRLARRVTLDHAALDLEVAAGERERGARQPDRVVVLGDHRRREVAGGRVQALPRRLAMRVPVAAPPAVATEPAPPRWAGRRA